MCDNTTLSREQVLSIVRFTIQHERNKYDECTSNDLPDWWRHLVKSANISLVEIEGWYVGLPLDKLL